MEISFEGTLTKDEFLNTSKLGRRPRVKNKGTILFDVWLVLLLVGAILVAVSIWQMTASWGQGSASRGAVVWLALLIFGVVILIFGMKTQSAPKKLWEQNEAFRAHRHGKITDQGIEVYTPFGQSKLQWKDLTGYGEYKEILVLFQGTALAIPFPKRLFANEEEWELFRSAVTERLDITHQVTEVSTPQILIYVLVLVAIIALVMEARGTLNGH